MISRSIAVLSLVALCLSLAFAPSSNAQTSGTAKVRVVHAAPGVPAVDIYVDGQKSLSNVAFFTAGAYLSVPAGNRQVQVTLAGQPLNMAVINQQLPVEAGKAYTVAATGQGAGVQATPFEDNLTPPAPGQVKVRVYHFSPNAPNVDVRLANNTVLIPNLAFRAASDYLEVPAGEYDLKVTETGETAAVIPLNDTALAAGRTYSVFAVGLAGGNPALRAEIRVNQFSAGAASKVRVVHAAPDAPNVDVYVDGERALPNVAFKAISEYLSVPAGGRLIQVTAAGQPLNTAVISAEVDLAGGAAYTIAATGTISASDDADFGPTVITDALEFPAGGKAAVRVYHFSPDAPNVDVSLASGADLISDLGFREAGDYLQVISGTYDLKVTPAGGTATVIDLADTELEGGKLYSVFAFGFAAGTPAISAGVSVTEFSRARVVHAAPDAPNVDVYVDGAPALNNVPFTGVSDYLPLMPGDSLVQVTPAGNPDLLSSVISATVTFDANAAYTVAATGTVSATDDADFGPTVISDTLTAAPFGQSKVRVYHFSPNAGPVDVSLADNTDVFPNLDFRQASVYRNLPSGVYNLKVTPAGGTPTVIDLANTTIDANRIYSVFAFGIAGASGEQRIRAGVAVTAPDATFPTLYLPIVRR